MLIPKKLRVVNFLKKFTGYLHQDPIVTFSRSQILLF
jgi:hypothetical protein